jgi:hypothetical protein
MFDNSVRRRTVLGWILARYTHMTFSTNLFSSLGIKLFNTNESMILQTRDMHLTITRPESRALLCTFQCTKKQTTLRTNDQISSAANISQTLCPKAPKKILWGRPGGTVLRRHFFSLDNFFTAQGHGCRSLFLSLSVDDCLLVLHLLSVFSLLLF